MSSAAALPVAIRGRQTKNDHNGGPGLTEPRLRNRAAGVPDESKIPNVGVDGDKRSGKSHTRRKTGI